MIKIDNISFSYGREVIFENASMTFPSTGIYILKGENGAGKSTLLKLVLGIEKISKGKINIDGLEINSKSQQNIQDKIKEKVAYISQENDLIDYINARENASLYQITHGEEIKKIKFLPDTSYGNRQVNTLSSGEKTIIAIQRAINENKSILLLDECTDYLDTKNTLILINLIKELSKECLILLVSHDERVISEFANHVVIKDKKIIFDIKSEDKQIVKASNEIKTKKYCFILKKYLYKQKFIISFLSLLFVIFNVLYLIVFSMGTYSFNKSYDSLVEKGYYSLCEKNELTIKDIFGVESDTFIGYDLSPFSYQKEEQIKEKEFLDNYRNWNYTIVDEEREEYAYIAKDDFAYFSNYINGDYVSLLTSNKTSFKLPYKIVDDTRFVRTVEISKKY